MMDHEYENTLNPIDKGYVNLDDPENVARPHIGLIPAGYSKITDRSGLSAHSSAGGVSGQQMLPEQVALIEDTSRLFIL